MVALTLVDKSIGPNEVQYTRKMLELHNDDFRMSSMEEFYKLGDGMERVRTVTLHVNVPKKRMHSSRMRSDRCSDCQQMSLQWGRGADPPTDADPPPLQMQAPLGRQTFGGRFSPHLRRQTTPPPTPVDRQALPERSHQKALVCHICTHMCEVRF